MVKIILFLIIALCLITIVSAEIITTYYYDDFYVDRGYLGEGLINGWTTACNSYLVDHYIICTGDLAKGSHQNISNTFVSSNFTFRVDNLYRKTQYEFIIAITDVHGAENGYGFCIENGTNDYCGDGNVSISRWDNGVETYMGKFATGLNLGEKHNYTLKKYENCTLEIEIDGVVKGHVTDCTHNITIANIGFSSDTGGDSGFDYINVSDYLYPSAPSIIASKNTSIPYIREGSILNLSMDVSDPTGLSHCWFWNNMSEMNSSLIALSGTIDNDKCWNTTSINVSRNVLFIGYANDTSGLTSSHNFEIIIDTQPPLLTLNETDIYKFQYNLSLHNVTFNENFNFSCSIFSWNISGKYVNDSLFCYDTTITNIKIQFNKTISPNPTTTSVGWMVYFNDTSGNANHTNIFQYDLLSIAPTLSQSGLYYYNQTTTAGKFLNISFDLSHNITQTFNYTISYSNFTCGVDINISIFIANETLFVTNKTINSSEIRFNITNTSYVGTCIGNITVNRSTYDMGIFNFPVAIISQLQTASIAFNDTNTWTVTGTSSGTFSRTFNINNSGNYNASLCSLESTSLLNSYISINETNFNITNMTTRDILVTVTEPSAIGYDEFLKATCVGTSSGDLVTTTSNVRLQFTISSPPSAIQPTGGGGAVTIIKEEDNLTSIISFGLDTISFFVITVPSKTEKILRITNIGDKDFTGDLIITGDISGYITGNVCDINIEDCVSEGISINAGESKLLVLSGNFDESLGKSKDGILQLKGEKTFEVNLVADRPPLYWLYYWVSVNFGTSEKTALASTYLVITLLIGTIVWSRLYG